MKKLKLIKEEDSNQIKESDIVDSIHEVIEKIIIVRGEGDFKGNAIYLPTDYDYVLGKDSENVTILVPLKKK